MPAERIPQSQAIRVSFNAVLSSDHASAATGKTIAIQLSKNGGAFANPAVGAVNATEVSGGLYYADLTAADTATLGPLVLKGTAGSTDTVFVFFDVVSLAAASSTIPSSTPPSGGRFRTAVDIANRACDHCGADRIDTSLGFTESSLRAALCGAIYDQLRLAELRANCWRFATKRVVVRAFDTNTRLLAPSLWVSSTTYFVGSVVEDQSGQLWISVVADNLANTPGVSLTAWQEYFGPLSVSLYTSTVSYFAGELVYTTDGTGTNRVYLSLQNANTDNPATATAWDATAVYNKNDVVTSASVAYMSKIDFNNNQTPSATTAAANWSVIVTYPLNALVNGSDGVTYKSLAGGNAGHDPTTDGGLNWQSQGFLTPWTTTFTGGSGSLKWRQIGGTEFPMGVGLSNANIVYPIGTGPSTQAATRNVFHLPANFLRQAPSDPKAGSISLLGAPTALLATDWLLEGDYIVSAETGPIMLRFVADLTDVSEMDPMFCEGLGARIGLEICERLTQSSEKLKTIAAAYQKFIEAAKVVNGIEIGSEEAALDDFIACRV